MDKIAETGLEAIWEGVSRFSGLCERLGRKSGESYEKIELLYAISSYSPVTQKDLAQWYQMPKQSVNNIIRQFEADSVITLKDSKKDKRQKEIYLTEQGKDYAAKLLTPVYEFNSMMVKKVGVKVVNQISDGLNKLSDAILEIEAEMEKGSK